MLAVALTACSSDDATTAQQWTVDAGALKLRVTENPWNMTFFDAAGESVLVELPGSDDGAVGGLGVHVGPPLPGNGQREALPPLVDGMPSTPPALDEGWIRATGVESSTYEGATYIATVSTTDPNRRLLVRAGPDPEVEGAIEVTVAPIDVDGVQALSIGFVAESEERFVGFGERSNAVNQAGWDLEHYVADGPYYDGQEYAVMGEVLPPAGLRWRADSTYFPIPWLLSSRGYGVLIDNDEISYHRVRSVSQDAWVMEVETSEMRFRVFGGPKPVDALRRYTDAVGRQPSNYAPWFFGPWLQTERDEQIDEFRQADVPTSLNATYLHYLPCGAQQGREDEQPIRTAFNHEMGVAIHTYFNPMICVSYEPAFGIADDMGALIEHQDGTTYVYDYSSNLGNSFEVSQFDFKSEHGVAAYQALTDEALDDGYDGWMEDFGEYTPLDAVSADGATGTRFHNRYARDYHCGVYEATRDVDRPIARFTRSGWTGSPACSPIVWGGDPTTGWDYDGLESSIYRALSIGASGVGIWGSDIGGFFAMFGRSLSDELFDRWIAYGGLSVVMRSQKNGVELTPHDRPQPWYPSHQPIWRRYAKLHTQLYPYLQAAAEDYYATGQPIMRHHVLTHPDDSQATARDDQYMFGPSILVAPVYVEGATERELYLPSGSWVEWWRSVSYQEQGGAFTLTETTIRDGGRSVSVPAPVDEIPMFIEAGAIIPMLSPDVFTLAEYGDNPDIVHASDRDGFLHVLGFPHGETSGRFYDDGTWTSAESEGDWRLTITNDRERTIHLEAAMNTRIMPVPVCGVRLDGIDLPVGDWSFDDTTGVLEVTYTTIAGTLEALGC
jgi:alpha-glucosidase (family GH31 glycosyl hydrolase)